MTDMKKQVINEILDLRQKLAELEAKAGMNRVEKPRGFATLEKVDKKPTKQDGLFYYVVHTIYDSTNNVLIPADTVIQTKCVGWVKRMGKMLDEASTRLPPKYDPADVLILSNTIEDGGTVMEKEEEPAASGRPRFSRKATEAYAGS